MMVNYWQIWSKTFVEKKELWLSKPDFSLKFKMKLIGKRQTKQTLDFLKEAKTERGRKQPALRTPKEIFILNGEVLWFS